MKASIVNDDDRVRRVRIEKQLGSSIRNDYLGSVSGKDVRVSMDVYWLASGLGKCELCSLLDPFAIAVAVQTVPLGGRMVLCHLSSGVSRIELAELLHEPQAASVAKAYEQFMSVRRGNASRSCT